MAKSAKTTKSTKSPQPQARQLLPPKKGLALRMYRQGLGDCFLLAFPGKGSEPVHMLIDCGVHSAQAGGSTKLEGRTLLRPLEKKLAERRARQRDG